MNDYTELADLTIVDAHTSSVSNPEPGQSAFVTRPTDARLGDTEHAGPLARDTQASDAGVGEAGVQTIIDPHELEDLRFADPLVARISALWRQRMGSVRAVTRLVLQTKAMCRGACGGDKDEAGKLYKAILCKGEHPLADEMRATTAFLFEMMKPGELARAALEKQLAKDAKLAPIWPWAEKVWGIGPMTVAMIIGECGDLSQYRTVSAVWKRAGLAVIDGQRQRRVTDPELALVHGYSPARRSHFYNVSSAILRAGEAPEGTLGYRPVYESRKLYYQENRPDWTKAHIHNAAMRVMVKELLEDMTNEWRRIARLRNGLRGRSATTAHRTEARRGDRLAVVAGSVAGMGGQS